VSTRCVSAGKTCCNTDWNTPAELSQRWSRCYWNVQYLYDII